MSSAELAANTFTEGVADTKTAKAQYGNAFKYFMRIPVRLIVERLVGRGRVTLFLDQ